MGTTFPKAAASPPVPKQNVAHQPMQPEQPALEVRGASPAPVVGTNTSSGGGTPSSGRSSKNGRRTPLNLDFIAEEPEPGDTKFVPRPSTAPARATLGGPLGDVNPSPELTFPASARVGCGRRPRPALNLAIPADAHHNVTKILDFMLVGGDDISTNLVILKEHNVKTIVNATTDGEETLPEKSGILYLKLHWKDEADQPILADLERAFKCIDEAQRRGGVCLVHCKSGMSRSGSVAIAYLMHAQHMTLLDALTFCRNKRPIISPNPGFMCQLVEYEQQERGSVSVDVSKYEDHRFGDTSVLVCAA